ncbi:hypothetical protein HK098_004554 [Nowakowskiella sp. JEL0407]|nr:hypothetical protein HK098_004554 [Nowakowskiella sp. JEL0407]
MSPKEISSIIIRENFTVLGNSSTATATVSLQISNHFDKSSESSRVPLLGKTSITTSTSSTRGQRYFIDQEGVPVNFKSTTPRQSPRLSTKESSPERRITRSNSRMSLRSNTGVRKVPSSSRIIQTDSESSEFEEEDEESSTDFEELSEEECGSEKPGFEEQISPIVEPRVANTSKEIESPPSSTLTEAKQESQPIISLSQQSPPPALISDSVTLVDESLPSLATSPVSEASINEEFSSFWSTSANNVDFLNEALPLFSENPISEDNQTLSFESSNVSNALFADENKFGGEMLSNQDIAKLLSEDSDNDEELKIKHNALPSISNSAKPKSKHTRNPSLRGLTLRKAFQVDSTTRNRNCHGRGTSVYEAHCDVRAITPPAGAESVKQEDDLDNLVDFDGDESDYFSPQMTASSEFVAGTDTNVWVPSKKSSGTTTKPSQIAKEIKYGRCPVTIDFDSLTFVAPTSTATTPNIWLTNISGIAMFILLISRDPLAPAPKITKLTKSIFEKHNFLLRRADETDAVNGSLLLYAGGISESERTMILSLERSRVRLSREFNSPLSGTWIPLNRAQNLATSCCLADRLLNFLDERLLSQWSAADMMSVLQLNLPETSQFLFPQMDKARSESPSDESKSEELTSIVIPADDDKDDSKNAGGQVSESESVQSSLSKIPAEMVATALGQWAAAAHSAYQTHSLMGMLPHRRRALRRQQQRRNLMEFELITISPVKISKDAVDIVAAEAAKLAAKEQKKLSERLRSAKRSTKDDDEEDEIVDIDSFSSDEEELKDVGRGSEDSFENPKLKMKINIQNVKRVKLGSSSAESKPKKPTTISTPSVSREPVKKPSVSVPSVGGSNESTKTKGTAGVDADALKKILDDAREKVANRKRLIGTKVPGAMSSANSLNIPAASIPPIISPAPVLSNPTTTSPPPVTSAFSATTNSPANIPIPTPTPPPQILFPFPFAGFPVATFPPFAGAFPFTLIPPLGIPFAVPTFGVFGSMEDMEKKAEEVTSKKRGIQEDEEIIDIEGDEEEGKREENGLKKKRKVVSEVDVTTSD